jgi:rubrerythrin
MDLERMLRRCHALEQRAAGLYRSFAAASRSEPAACAGWTALAREEDEHAESIARVRRHLAEHGVSHASIDGWEEALAEVEERLAAAERLGASATADQRLAAALELEMTELDAFRMTLLAAANEGPPTEHEDHVERLAAAAEASSADPQVRLQVALLRARARLRRR